MKKILFPVEDLNISEKALAMTADLSLKYGAEVILVHVQPLNEPMSYPYAHTLEPWDQEVFNEISERIVSNAVSKFLEAGITTTTRILSGNPASEILECASEENCDMIIMNTHSMSTIKRFLLGSVTNKVVLHANVPVLVVR